MSDEGSLEYDQALFGAGNHHHLTVVEVAVVDPWGANSGAVVWRLWCLNCDLRGKHLFVGRDSAAAAADGLRSVAEPSCQHRSSGPKVPP